MSGRGKKHGYRQQRLPMQRHEFLNLEVADWIAFDDLDRRPVFERFPFPGARPWPHTMSQVRRSRLRVLFNCHAVFAGARKPSAGDAAPANTQDRLGNGRAPPGR